MAISITIIKVKQRLKDCKKERKKIQVGRKK